MSSREEILQRLRKNTCETYDKPDLSQLKPVTYADPVAEFITKTTTTAGAKLIEMKADEDLNEIVRRAYPDTKVVASNLPCVEADMNPDTVSDAKELMAVDMGVIEGCIGVAENACIWIPQQMKEKSICFASQQLVIVLRRDAIVSNMHEAYARIAASKEYFSQYKFGTFISGPSKTADIESALVYGAQAARGVTVVLR
ncbi:MAG: LUD domain-containing protein [Prevotella sp.]|nr:LUD domain-containing protein [Prevotella sp.]